MVKERKTSLSVVGLRQLRFGWSMAHIFSADQHANKSLKFRSRQIIVRYA